LVGPVWATVFSVGAVLLVGLFFLAIAVRRNDRRIAAYRAEEEARLQTEYAEIEAERRSAEEKRKAAKREKEQGEAEKLAEFWRQSEEQREAEEREANAKRLAEAEERAAAVRLAEFRRRPKLVIIVALAAAELAAVPVYLQWRGCA
jgi:hypothetical protein